MTSWVLPRQSDVHHSPEFDPGGRQDRAPERVGFPYRPPDTSGREWLYAGTGGPVGSFGGLPLLQNMVLSGVVHVLVVRSPSVRHGVWLAGDSSWGTAPLSTKRRALASSQAGRSDDSHIELLAAHGHLAAALR